MSYYTTTPRGAPGRLEIQDRPYYLGGFHPATELTMNDKDTMIEDKDTVIENDFGF
jgi:hypothetical protein